MTRKNGDNLLCSGQKNTSTHIHPYVIMKPMVNVFMT